MQELQSIKTIGSKGQISLGKQFVGRPVIVEQREPGVWLIRTITIVPHNEKWIHETKAAAELAAALNWSTATSGRDQNL